MHVSGGRADAPLGGAPEASFALARHRTCGTTTFVGTLRWQFKESAASGPRNTAIDETPSSDLVAVSTNSGSCNYCPGDEPLRIKLELGTFSFTLSPCFLARVVRFDLGAMAVRVNCSSEALMGGESGQRDCCAAAHKCIAAYARQGLYLLKSRTSSRGKTAL